MKNRLPGLNGLRAIAASFVLFSHVYQIAGIEGDARAKAFYWHHNLLGGNMVNLFFVISGFIITHILFQEKNRTGTISLRHFYLKRILRIWPIYFGIILLVFLIGYFTNWYDGYSKLNLAGALMLGFFVMNFQLFIPGTRISVLPHYWSLSIEEQFYFLWPAFFKYLKGKRSLYFPIIVVLGVIAARGLVVVLYRFWPSQLLLDILETLSLSKFGSISLGVIAAGLLHYGHPLLRYIYKPGLQLVSWVVFLLTIVLDFKIPYIHYELTAVMFAVVVLNVTTNPSSLLKMENRFLDSTGMISYGLYMFHWPLIPLIILVVKQTGCWTFMQQTYQIPMVLISFALTWGVAWISYRYFESYFLSLRPGHHQSGPQTEIKLPA